MSIFFPLLNDTQIYNSSTRVYNFSPNNYELIKNKSRYLSIIWPDNQRWKTLLIDKLDPFESREIFYKSFKSLIPKKVITILSLTSSPLSENLNRLPSKTIPESSPIWRSTININIKNSITSYQGEIKPFPETASLLSFSTFIQKRKNNKNFLIFINLSVKANQKLVPIKIAKASEPKKIIGNFYIKTNACNLIAIDDLKLQRNDIAVFYSNEVSGIPIFLSYSEKDMSISLEHTHPPSNLIIHGDRKNAQKIIKRNWFNLLRQ